MTPSSHKNPVPVKKDDHAPKEAGYMILPRSFKKVVRRIYAANLCGLTISGFPI
jgi:hypothetical protein